MVVRNKTNEGQVLQRSLGEEGVETKPRFSSAQLQLTRWSRSFIFQFCRGLPTVRKLVQLGLYFPRSVLPTDSRAIGAGVSNTKDFVYEYQGTLQFTLLLCQIPESQRRRH